MKTVEIELYTFLYKTKNPPFSPGTIFEKPVIRLVPPKPTTVFRNESQPLPTRDKSNNIIYYGNLYFAVFHSHVIVMYTVLIYMYMYYVYSHQLEMII